MSTSAYPRQIHVDLIISYLYPVMKILLKILMELVCVCVCVCVRACVRACMRACMRVQYTPTSDINNNILVCPSGYLLSKYNCSLK